MSGAFVTHKVYLNILCKDSDFFLCVIAIDGYFFAGIVAFFCGDFCGVLLFVKTFLKVFWVGNKRAFAKLPLLARGDNACERCLQNANFGCAR